MCGIAGFLGYGDLRVADVPVIASRMSDAIRHRGPDDSGIWCDDAAQVALAHRRLSVVDLSPAGHQPMSSASGRFVMVFNGEIYNHQNLRREVEKARADPMFWMSWRGHSDTETLLACIELWGLEETLRRSVGMFAIALWDRQDRMLCLARDRIGEKPLFYGWQRGVFLFGSDLKAIRAHPAFVGEIDRSAISLQLRYSYIPAPYSIYKRIGKLPPGCILRMHASTSTGAHVNGVEAAKPYWALEDVVRSGQTDPFKGTDKEAVDALDRLLRDAVARQMVADVPLGAFLSGGVDSSTIVALMQLQSSRPVKTFTIGFDETVYNEAEHAKAVARHLGTEHTELYVKPEQALNVIPRLPELYNEPFSDQSQIPTFLVSELTRQHVTVSLSGDAGDELFGGYNRYVFVRNLWARISRLPQSLRQIAASSIRAVPPSGWNSLARLLQGLLPVSLPTANFGDTLHKGAALLDSGSPGLLYLGMVSHWEPDCLVLGAQEPQTVLCSKYLQLSELEAVQRMMALDTMTYLPDDILVKVDRAAMGVSLETRVPMLDHHVVEFAWRLPVSMKMRDGQGKWILRQVLSRYVPRNLFERPKMGFGMPIHHWLRGPLRDWAENLLDESRLRQDGFFNPVPIRQKWAEHLSGKLNWQYHLWDVLMFQAWLNAD